MKKQHRQSICRLTAMAAAIFFATATWAQSPAGSLENGAAGTSASASARQKTLGVSASALPQAATQGAASATTAQAVTQDAASATTAQVAAQDTANATITQTVTLNTADATAAQTATPDAASASTAQAGAQDAVDATITQAVTPDTADATTTQAATQDAASATVAQVAAQDTADAPAAQVATQDAASATTAQIAAQDTADATITQAAMPDTADATTTTQAATQDAASAATAQAAAPDAATAQTATPDAVSVPPRSPQNAATAQTTTPDAASAATASPTTLGVANVPAPAATRAAPPSVAPQSGATTAAPTDDGPVRLKDFTVTARRRAESAQNVPAPISTVSGSDLERQREYRIQDLQDALPSFNVAFINPRQSSVSIRGIGNNPASDDLEPSVGVYLDNVYLGRPGMAVFDLLDISQVDLLRGPQGTLFGKNATAGVLNIATRQPQFDPQAYVEQSVGGNGYIQTRAHVTGPLSDTLAGSVTLVHTQNNGNVTNIYNGQRIDNTDDYGVRGELLWKPDASLSGRFIVDYDTVNSNSGGQLIYGVPPGSPFLARAALLGATPVLNPARSEVNINSPQHMDVHQGGASAEFNFRLPDGYTLTSITAGRFWNFAPSNDGDALPAPAIVDSGVQVQDHQLSQELRIASPTGGRFDWVAGAYYFYQQTNTTTFNAFGPDADVFLFGVNRNILNNVTAISPARVITNSAALFGQGTWHINTRADLTAGIRGTYEDKTGVVTRYAPVGGADLPAGLEAVRNASAGAYYSGPLGIHSLSPSGLLNFSYKLAPDVLAYATLSHGEKSGGINMAVGSAPTLGPNSLIFGPERANDVELGIKSEWLDHRLIVNANLFWMQINGYQATTYVLGPSGLLTQVLANAADVRSRGAEIDVRARPIRNLTLGFNASYDAATYSSFLNAPCPLEVQYASGRTTCNLTGQAVAGAPRWIANLMAQYDFHLGRDIGQYVAADYSLRSSQYGTLDDSKYAKLPGYGIVNLATGWHPDSGQHRWDFSLWVHNLFNRHYYLASFESTNIYTAMIGDPRVVGATFRYTW